MKKQNKNLLYNIAYQILLFIVPLITTPYISRQLGVNNIGIYSYTYSFVSYFMLAALLGINNYGAREIAKCKTSEKTSKTFLSIYTLQVILTIICTTIYLLSIFFLPFKDKTIMVIQCINLLSVMLDVNWFFIGKENFKIIVTRNTLIKIISTIAIFCFVNGKDDLWIYTMITSISTVLGQLCLFPLLKKEIKSIKICAKDVIQHLHSCLVLFIPVIAYSIYRIMDKTMIGTFTDTIELGNYESAEKVINIPVSIITAFGTVMLPYMSKKKGSEIKNSLDINFELILFIILPILVGLFIISEDFALLFFGQEYKKTGIIIKLLLPSVLFASIANVIRTNFLIPRRQDNIYIMSTICGAVVNFVLNILFVPHLGAIGACIGTIAAEFTVMIYQIAHTYMIINFRNILKYLIKYLIPSFLCGIGAYIIGRIIESPLFKISAQILIATIIYATINIRYIRVFIGKSQEERRITNEKIKS